MGPLAQTTPFIVAAKKPLPWNGINVLCLDLETSLTRDRIYFAIDSQLDTDIISTIKNLTLFMQLSFVSVNTDIILTNQKFNFVYLTTETNSLRDGSY